MKPRDVFVLIEGVEMVCRDGEWARVPTTILYTGDDQDFWEIATLEAKNQWNPVLVVQTV